MTFGMILLACLVPIVMGVVATQMDENIAMHGGFHKKHL